ncbi:hypothetical protein PR048_018534 [Dryococelus australis]|uniref:MADF domain-containing protein n=1 Tax=Dryococelus australis TaxID=614101 RepID=A0ABQ9HCJ4_9NEOP|nr:hypothetical protein PR048_018534 [Dryococelus australis]
MNYKVKNARYDALTAISAVLDMPKHEGERKIKNFVGQFAREIKKVKTSGSGADPESMSTWTYFRALLFLKDRNTRRASRSTLRPGTHSDATHLDTPRQVADVSTPGTSGNASSQQDADTQCGVKSRQPPTFQKKRKMIDPRAEEAFQIVKAVREGRKERIKGRTQCRRGLLCLQAKTMHATMVTRESSSPHISLTEVLSIRCSQGSRHIMRRCLMCLAWACGGHLTEVTRPGRVTSRPGVAAARAMWSRGKTRFSKSLHPPLVRTNPRPAPRKIISGSSLDEALAMNKAPRASRSQSENVYAYNKETAALFHTCGLACSAVVEYRLRIKWCLPPGGRFLLLDDPAVLYSEWLSMEQPRDERTGKRQIRNYFPSNVANFTGSISLRAPIKIYAVRVTFTRENPPTSGIVLYDSRKRETGRDPAGIESGSPRWEANRLTVQPPRPRVQAVQPDLLPTQSAKYSGLYSDSCTGARATVAERLACSPPTKANRVQSAAGSLPDFRKWESCRTIPLVGGLFSGISRFSPPFHSGAAPHSSQSPTSALKTSPKSFHSRTFPISRIVVAPVQASQSRIHSRHCRLLIDCRDQYKIDVKHVYTEIDFAIGWQFIRHELDDSEPIADLQGNNCQRLAGQSLFKHSSASKRCSSLLVASEATGEQLGRAGARMHTLPCADTTVWPTSASCRVKELGKEVDLEGKEGGRSSGTSSKEIKVGNKRLGRRNMCTITSFNTVGKN